MHRPDAIYSSHHWAVAPVDFFTSVVLPLVLLYFAAKRGGLALTFFLRTSKDHLELPFMPYLCHLCYIFGLWEETKVKNTRMTKRPLQRPCVSTQCLCNGRFVMRALSTQKCNLCNETLCKNLKHKVKVLWLGLTGYSYDILYCWLHSKLREKDSTGNILWGYIEEWIKLSSTASLFHIKASSLLDLIICGLMETETHFIKTSFHLTLIVRSSRQR